jgi:hypothetical protein
MSRGGDAWGHDLTALLSALPADCHPPADLLDRARALDKHYITSRYPNGFAAGTPRDHYTLREADIAIADAEAIVDVTACTRQELARELAAGNRFLARIMSESVVLYARTAPGGDAPSPRPDAAACG